MNHFKHQDEISNVQHEHDAIPLDDYLLTIKIAYEVCAFLHAKGLTKSQSFNVVSQLLELLRDIHWK